MLPVVQIGISLLSAYGAFQYLHNYMYLEGLIENTWSAHKNLTNNVFGQSIAIYQLMEFLLLEPKNGTDILLIVGGTGVGKTYAMSIIKKHYKPEEFIVEILPGVHKFDDQTLIFTTKIIKWITKGFSLVIIDGADLLDNDLIQFVLKLNEYGYKNNLWIKIIIMGQIIKTHSTSSSDISADSFKSMEEYSNFIITSSVKAKLLFDKNNLKNCELALFMPLAPKHINHCVLKSISTLAVQGRITAGTIKNIVNDVCEGRDDYCPSGCKDVDAYVLSFAT